jgi:hypothetical protein
MKQYASGFIETIKNNTTGAGELVRQGFLAAMALGWVTLTQEQFITVMSFFSALIAYIGFKTTIATNKVDQRVADRVATAVRKRDDSR